MSDEKKKGFVMYRSFINSIRNLKPQDFKDCVLALADYAFEGKEYDGENPVVTMYMELVKPQVDANNARYENGKKGGRPPKEKQEDEPLADVEAIPLNDGTEWLPTKSQYEEFCRLYPNVNIEQEFRNMRGWSNNNPKKRKTKAGVKRFVNSWLQREQDKGGKYGSAGIAVPMPTYITNQIAGNIPKGRPATSETLEKVRQMQEEMKGA